MHVVINHSKGKVSCKPDGKGWIFCSCLLTTPMFIVHVFNTMQTAAIVRAVFIKTTKKTTTAQDYRHFVEELKHIAW